MNFESLPLEIKSHIFSFLPVDDLHLKVAHVSKKWQALSRDPHVVKHIDVYKWLYPEKIIQRLVTYNFARSLKFTEIFDFHWILDIPINNNLRRLHIDGCYFKIETLQVLSTRFPMISKLKFVGCEYAWTATSTPSDLKRSISSEYLQLFAENCQRLEEVEIASYDSVDETSCQTLFDLHGASLTTLRLLGEDLTDKNFTTLTQCSRITDLHLYSLNTMTSSQLLCIKKLRSLRILSIMGANNVSSNAIVELFTEPTFPHLQSINLRDCHQLSDDVIDLITKSYPCLKSLNLSNCFNITDSGVKSVLENCSTLENLNLSRNKILTGSILTLITTSRMTHLNYLNIYGCNRILSESYREELTRSHPGLCLIDTASCGFIAQYIDS